MARTQPRAFGSGTGARYRVLEPRGGSGGGRALGGLTAARAFGAGVGGRYGSFEGRGGGARPASGRTQAHAFGAHVGVRYGSFAGRGSAIPPQPGYVGGGGPLYLPVPRDLKMRQRAGLIDDDELVLLVIMAALPTLILPPLAPAPHDWSPT